MSIRLTQSEKQLFQLLKEVSVNKVVCRVAGGWVRDKLLGNDCDDLDVSLDTMMGYDFAMLLQGHAKGKIKNLFQVKANPTKSKHLETAKMTIMGLSVDFVNLRSESYEQNSRIPEIEFGTPLQDALRRDLTINSMFYNIHTDEIEDLTGMGLKDLQNKVIRTPLDPEKTFMDDPLRVLRVIRFASRLNFHLTKEIVDAAQLPHVLDDLARKISKERIGTEVLKMFNGPSPEDAIQYLESLQILRKLSGTCPLNTCKSDQDFEKSVLIAKLLRKTEQNPLFKTNSNSYFAAICVGLDSLHVLKEHYKQPTAVGEWVQQCLKAVPFIIEATKTKQTRLDLAKLVRKCCSIKCTDFNQIATFALCFAAQEDNFDSMALDFQELLLQIKKEELENAWNLKRLVKGDELMKLGVQKKELRDLLEETIHWQIENQKGTHEECLNYFKRRKINDRET